jgi:hypothetical protein
MKAALKVVTSAKKHQFMVKGKSLREIESEYENYSGYDPEDPMPSMESDGKPPWETDK